MTKISSGLALLVLALSGFTAQAATKPSQALELVNGCDSNTFFAALPFVARDKDVTENARVEFKDALAKSDSFVFVQDSFSTVKFGPKQGIGLNRWKMAEAMESLLAEVEPLFQDKNGAENGGIFCVVTFDLPDNF